MKRKPRKKSVINFRIDKHLKRLFRKYKIDIPNTCREALLSELQQYHDCTDWSEGVCLDCGYECEHDDFIDHGICGTCGHEVDRPEPYNEDR